jgi:hypothetical protein
MGWLAELSESVEEGEKAVGWAVATDSRFAVRSPRERGLLELHIGMQMDRGSLDLLVSCRG